MTDNSQTLLPMAFQAVPIRSGDTRECPECRRPFLPYKRAEGRQVFCGTECRVRAWKRDNPDGADLKARGKTLAADRNPEMLQTFRRLARELALEAGEVCIDDVRARAELLGIRYESGNWIGSVFSEPGWQFVRYRRATHASAHARPVGVWRLS